MPSTLTREKGSVFVQGVTAAAPKGCQQQQYRSNDRALRTHAGSAVNFPRLGLTQLGRAVRRYTYAGAALVSDADNLRLVHAPLFGACDLFRPALQPAAHVNQTVVHRLQCPNQPSQSHYIQMKAASTDAPRTTLAANTTTSQHIQVCALICIL